MSGDRAVIEGVFASAGPIDELITDYDVGMGDVPPVTNEEVVRVFGENNSKVRELIYRMIPALPTERECVCATALEGAAF